MLNKISTRTVIFTVLFTLIAAPLSAVLASPPASWYWEGNGTDPGLVDCGDFIIDGEWSAWERGRTVFDRDGNVTVTVVNSHFLGTLTNRETGLTIHDDGYVTVREHPDRGTITSSGLVWNLNVPGHGVVALDAGSMVFDATTLELLHERGPHQVWHGLDVWGPDGVLCTYMRE